MNNLKYIPYPVPLPTIERDEKGRIITPLPQDTNKNGTTGRPCKYCSNKDEYQKITNEYVRVSTRSEGKVTIPFIEELSLKLGVHRETVLEWAKHPDHPEFSDSISTLQTIQSLRLQQRILGRYNPTGAIALLKWHHGMIETSKQILAGDKDEPIEVKIVEEQVREIPE